MPGLVCSQGENLPSPYLWHPSKGRGRECALHTPASLKCKRRQVASSREVCRQERGCRTLVGRLLLPSLRGEENPQNSGPP